MQKLGTMLGLCTVLMILLSFMMVVLRSVFNFTSVAVQEVIIYLHSIVFMLGIVYAYHHDKHVRIDVFYQKYSPFTKDKVNTFGVLILLIPFFIFMFFVSFDYVLASWKILESSAEPGGIPFVYGLKTLLLVLPIAIVSVAIYRIKVKR